MLEEKSIKIQCPHCSKENDFKIGSGVKCEHCSEEITGYQYLKKAKSGLSTFIAGVCIVAGGHALSDKLFNDNRYPIETEYSIIESCLSSYDRPLKIRDFQNKKKICQHILKKTQEDVSYSDFQKDQLGFIGKFEENFNLSFGKQANSIGARY